MLHKGELDEGDVEVGGPVKGLVLVKCGITGSGGYGDGIGGF